jgi:regulatory protein YycI of two-component signal transduction system YycFG
MEWERAKNYIIIAFILLNCGLAGLLFSEDRRYTLGSDRITSIQAVLSENKINFSYTNLPRRFAPMRHLDISGLYYDVPALLEIFFEDEIFFEIETDEGYFIFETENTKLEISNGFISFDNSANLRENRIEDFSRAEAIKISEDFIAKHFSDFVRDIVFESDDGVRIRYIQEYRGQLIYSNLIEFFVLPQGIAWIEMEFGRVIGYSAEPRMIFAPDEILLTFMQRVRHRAMENPIFITHMDIVYKQEYASDQAGTIYPAVPFYRIFIRGEDFPFLINAYTNVLN